MSELIDNFKSLCLDYKIDLRPEQVAVIYRSKNLFNAITGIGEINYGNQPWTTDCPYSKEFAKGKYLFSTGEFRKGFSLIQSAIIKALTHTRFCATKDIERVIEINGFVKFREDVYELIKKLPDTNCKIGEWIDGANAIFIDNKISIELKIKNSQRDISFDELFGSDNRKITENDFRIGTIHSVKGETFEAVLVVLKQKGIGKYYRTLLKENVAISDNEELRIVYVGITRPRRLLILAVPDDENKVAWENKLFDN
jgi:DNA helicase II / ATP-dependent DNA helicase PcrA